ncbi:hypothetical protein [Phaffia rhodozyma]|uniref:Uncharacterized protein n=1 Tax=Phaffia rhodozyma TaxID=264483 RepID=A0A0F7SG96_PHARH|nr:hypothetical protein [Phaffia rhodozyma]
MILKDDSPVGVLTRQVSCQELPSTSLPSSTFLLYPPSSSSASFHSDQTSRERIPSYHPPTFPPAAHMAVADPTPWSRYPPPKYKFKTRMSRFIPVLLVVGNSAIVLGASVTFMVESVIRIATTHIKLQMFAVFRNIVIPSNILIAASVSSLILCPIHHLLPLPSPARQSFFKAEFSYKLLTILRALIPIITTLLYLIGGCWFFTVALTKDVDEDKDDSSVPVGNGVIIHPDQNYPSDVLTSIVFLLNAFEHNIVHRVFTGTPPKKIGELEQRVKRFFLGSEMCEEELSALEVMLQTQDGDIDGEGGSSSGSESRLESIESTEKRRRRRERLARMGIRFGTRAEEEESEMGTGTYSRRSRSDDRANNMKQNLVSWWKTKKGKQREGPLSI